MVILVIGLPGTGKTTWAKEHIGNGLCYDLDHISAAFRLREPHEELHEASRMLANDMLMGFVREAVSRCDEDVFVIRAAPELMEVIEIMPDIIVECSNTYDISGRRDRKHYDVKRMLASIKRIHQWSETRNIPYYTTENLGKMNPPSNLK